MTRRAYAIVAGALICCLEASSVVSAEDLKVATFGAAYQAAVKASLWEPFEKKTGVNIIEATNEDDIGALRALAATSPSKWDVTEVQTTTLSHACDEGLALPIDKSLLPVNDFLPGSVSECGVVSASTATVMIYNKEKYGDNSPKTWADFFDVKRFPGKRLVTRYIQGFAPIAMLADGVPPDKVFDELSKPDGFDRVLKKAELLKGNVEWLSTGAQLIQGLVSGSVDLSAGWNGRLKQANEESGGKFAINWTAGYEVDTNSYLIPKTSANPKLAMEYIAFASQPGPQADLMRKLPYGQTNKKAYELLSVDEKALLPGDPSRLPYAVQENLDFWAGRVDDWQTKLEAWIASN